jgi:hypothetical protein
MRVGSTDFCNNIGHNRTFLSYATAHYWYGWRLIVMGRNDDGIAVLRTVESLDPLSPILSADLVDAFASLISMTTRCGRSAMRLNCTHSSGPQAPQGCTTALLAVQRPRWRRNGSRLG